MERKSLGGEKGGKGEGGLGKAPTTVNYKEVHKGYMTLTKNTRNYTTKHIMQMQFEIRHLNFDQGKSPLLPCLG